MTWSIIALPATVCSTFGRADFIRVPLPAARMTTCRSDIDIYSLLLTVGRLQIPRETANGQRLTPVGASGKFAPFWLGVRRGFQGAADAVELAQDPKFGVVAGERPVVGIQIDRAKEQGNGFIHLVAQ